MDDLSLSQFDLLVKVLSLSSFAWDFRHLLTPANLREAFDHPNEFVLLKVPHLNFDGSRDTRVWERIQSRLLSHIHVAFEEMSGGDIGDAFSLPPSPSCDLQARLNRPRELEGSGVSKLRERAVCQKSARARGKAVIPCQRDGARTTTASPEGHRPPMPYGSKLPGGTRWVLPAPSPSGRGKDN